MKRKTLTLIISILTVVALSFTNITYPDNAVNGFFTPDYAYGASLNAPEIKTVASIDKKVLAVSWSKVENATSYELYRATSKNGEYKFVKSTKATTYKNTGLEKDKAYYYKVKAVKGKAKSSFSKAVKGIPESQKKTKLSDIPEYSGTPYTVINDNVPYFTSAQKKLNAFEYYGALDKKGRCTTTISMISKSLMPKTERGSIGMIKPSGWQTVEYEGIIEDDFLYNRCHLIGYQLTGENANKKNLITGTRYMNVEGMLPFENKVAEYVRNTGKKVLYRVTPIFDGDNLLASGVQMEAYSIADSGKSISFNVFCYNVQPGITIDYKDGSSKANNGDLPKNAESNGTVSEKLIPTVAATVEKPKQTGEYFVINANSGIFHTSSCDSVEKMSVHNQLISYDTAEDILRDGYLACERCHPAGKGIRKYADLNKDKSDSKKSNSKEGSTTYILNTSKMKYHYPDCPSVSQMSEKNKKATTKSADELEAEGYELCGNCAKRIK